MTQMGIYFNQSRCTGCYTCVVACKDWYDIDSGPVSYMRVHCIERGVFPILFAAYLAAPCFHCENPPCIPACPEKAITKRDSDGIVMVDRDRCIGKDRCPEKCRKACPWDAPQFGPQANARMQKCMLCHERLAAGQGAICAEACPMFALEIGPLDELIEKHGDVFEAEGFKYFKRVKPSVTFTPKLQAPEGSRSGVAKGSQ